MRLFLSILGLCAIITLAFQPLNFAHAEEPVYEEAYDDLGEEPEMAEEDKDPCSDRKGSPVQYQKCQTYHEKVERMKAAAQKRKESNKAKKQQRTSGFKKNVEKKKAEMKKKKEEAERKAKEEAEKEKEAEVSDETEAGIE